MPAWGFRSTDPSAFLKRSSPANRTAPAWDSRSVGGSSNRMAAVCGRAPTQDGARLFSSRCRRRDWGLGAEIQRYGPRRRHHPPFCQMMDGDITVEREPGPGLPFTTRLRGLEAAPKEVAPAKPAK